MYSLTSTFSFRIVKIMSVLLEGRSYRPFKSSEEYLIAMKEDLAEWLNALYPELRINLDNFMDRLDTGVALCKVSVSQWFACQLTAIAEARLSVRFSARRTAHITRRSLSRDLSSSKNFPCDRDIPIDLNPGTRLSRFSRSFRVYFLAGS